MARNNEALCKLLRSATYAGYDQVLIVGDFNLPNIDWETKMSLDASTHFSHVFVETIQDCYLSQEVSEPTRYREGNTPHILDLILSTQDQLVRRLKYSPGIGKSDHLCLRFSLACAKRGELTSGTPRLALCRGDFFRMNELADDINWLAGNHLELEQEYDLLVSQISDLVKRCIPLQQPRRRRRQQYITREAMRCIKNKDRSLKAYKSASITEKAACWDDFKRKRNDLRRLTRRLRRGHQQKIAREAKNNPKLFWSYSHSQTKTRERVEDLLNTDGKFVTTDKDKANLLSSYFSSVFTKEDPSLVIPHLPEDEPADSLTDIDVTPAKVEGKLRNLKVTASPGLDGFHPRILKEVAAWICHPLSSIKIPEVWKDSRRLEDS